MIIIYYDCQSLLFLFLSITIKKILGRRYYEKKISREEVQKHLIDDAYFKKGHHSLKIFQTIIAILSWLAVLVPFIWIALPFIFPNNTKLKHFLVYKDELQLLKFLEIFLGIAFATILVVYILLTIWNNHRFKTLLQKATQYDEDQLAIRRQLLKEEYDKRFGPEEFRKEVCFYSVKEEQNFDTDFIRNLYEKNGAKL